MLLTEKDKLILATKTELDIARQSASQEDKDLLRKCEQLADDHALALRLLEEEKVQRQHVESAEADARARLAEFASKQARLAGHQNPNQRIHYTMQLKEQVVELQKSKAQLVKEQQRSRREEARAEGAACGLAHLELTHITNLVSTVLSCGNTSEDVITSLRQIVHR